MLGKWPKGYVQDSGWFGSSATSTDVTSLHIISWHITAQPWTWCFRRTFNGHMGKLQNSGKQYNLKSQIRQKICFIFKNINEGGEELKKTHNKIKGMNGNEFRWGLSWSQHPATWLTSLRSFVPSEQVSLHPGHILSIVCMAPFVVLFCFVFFKYRHV